MTVKENRDGKEVEKELDCNLLLDNFTYDRLAGDRSLDPDLRKEWLKRQPREHLDKNFRSQPFEQLVKVLRTMGHNKAADDISLEKRWYVWKAKLWRSGWLLWPIAVSAILVAIAVNLIQANFWPPWWLWLIFPVVLVIPPKHAELVFLLWFIGYGYRRARALVILLSLGFCFALFYQEAFEQAVIVPSDKNILKEKLASDCKNWWPSECSLAEKVSPSFNPWIYSADVIIPVVELGQKKVWQPATNKHLWIFGWESPTNFVYYMQLVETVLGWIGGALLGSVVSGLIKKE